MSRPTLPKELIKKYGISKKAWAVFRSRNAGRRVKKTVKRRAARKSRPRPSRRRSGVRTMVRRKRGRKGGRRKMGIPSLATIAVLIHALRETGILDMVLRSLGADRNIVEEAQTWAQTFEVGSLVDAAIPAVVLMFVRKFIGQGPKMGPFRMW